MKAGKFSTSIFQIASMPSSGYSTVSTFLMQCSARFAAVRAPKRFFRAAGAHHNDVFGSPGLVAAIAAFARETTGG